MKKKKKKENSKGLRDSMNLRWSNNYFSWGVLEETARWLTERVEAGVRGGGGMNNNKTQIFPITLARLNIKK